MVDQTGFEICSGTTGFRQFRVSTAATRVLARAAKSDTRGSGANLCGSEMDRWSAAECRECLRGLRFGRYCQTIATFDMRDSRIVFGPLSACIRKLCTDYRGGTQQDRGDDAASRTRIGGAWSYGQRRTNAAVTLLRLGEREKVLPVFNMTDDPEALTQFIFRCPLCCHGAVFDGIG